MQQLPLNMTEDYLIEIRDGDPRLRELYSRHYSRRVYADGRKPKKTVGPGSYMALISPNLDVIFVWRKFIDDSGQVGVNCAVFRNESTVLSSTIIRSALIRASKRWPGERFYTYVNPKKIKSCNPGCCFKKAGFKKTGVTKNGLIILSFSNP